MDYKLTNLPKSEAEIEVTIPFAEFKPYVKRAGVKISEETDIEGFRRGKAPYDVVKKFLGEAHIYEVAADLAVRGTYPEVVEKRTAESREKEKNFSPIGRPDIMVTKLAPGNEMRYKVKLALLPAVELPDYKTIAQETRKEKKQIAATDEEVNKTLEWVRDSRAELVPVARPAQKGDEVEIDFELRHDKVKMENGDSRNHPLVIGKGKFMPGFEDNLIGMTVDEKRNFSVAVPEDWHDKAMVGKQIDVTATMKSIKERNVPELTDEFVKRLGSFQNLAELRKNIAEGIMQEKQDKEKQRVRMLIIENIAKDANMEIPNLLVEKEFEKMMFELKSGVEDMGMNFEEYLLHIKKIPDTLREEWKPEAEKRVRIALALREIANRENIKPTDDEIQQEANTYLSRFHSTEETQQHVDPETLREYTRGVLRNEKVFEFLEQVN